MEYLYFEDCKLGVTARSRAVLVTQAEIIAFAEQFDPQPMHTDPVAALAITGGLIASGWHTASLTMRLLLEAQGKPSAPGMLGLGVERMKWSTPVRPGDELYAIVELVELRASASKPGRGIISSHVRTCNQNDQQVLELRTSALIPQRNFQETKK